ncbi:DUF2497 domain-containing protein [Sphingomonas sp. RS6]
MGDVSGEPSMEEILSSIKRIIAEEGDDAVTARSRRPGRSSAGSLRIRDAESDEVLELSEPVRDAAPGPFAASPAPRPLAEDEPAAASESPLAGGSLADPILSDRAAEASRGKLEALSRMVIKPQTAGADTLEGLVRELLKPMLRDWLDENLPRLVETMVSREIERITRGQ